MVNHNDIPFQLRTTLVKKLLIKNHVNLKVHFNRILNIFLKIDYIHFTLIELYNRIIITIAKNIIIS